MPKHVYRYVVNVDDQVHDIPDATVVHVGTRGINAVEVWLEVPEPVPAAVQRMRVFGTGHDIPDDAEHVGSTLTPGAGTFVWHLYRVDRSAGRPAVSS